MWPDQVLILGPLALESDALLTALCGPAINPLNTMGTLHLMKGKRYLEHEETKSATC